MNEIVPFVKQTLTKKDFKLEYIKIIKESDGCRTMEFKGVNGETVAVSWHPVYNEKEHEQMNAIFKFC